MNRPSASPRAVQTHLRYVARDGATPDGAPSVAYHEQVLGERTNQEQNRSQPAALTALDGVRLRDMPVLEASVPALFFRCELKRPTGTDAYT